MPAENNNMDLINGLPAELLSHIFSYLTDTPAPSVSRLQLEPALDITHSSVRDLKSLSSTCKRWRQLALPLLFKHATLAISPELILGDFSDVQNFTDFLLASPIDVPLGKYVTSLVLRIYKKELSEGHGKLPYVLDPKHLWDIIFKCINPSRVTIIAPPEILRCLIYSKSKTFSLSVKWIEPPHILSFEQDSNAEDASSFKEAVQNPQEQKLGTGLNFEPTNRLLERPWTNLTLNEGPLDKYHDYRQAPQSILEGPLLDNLFPSSVKDFSYIAMFPPPMHFANIVWNLPRVDRFYCQIVPRNTEMLPAGGKMDAANLGLWDRRNLSYSYLMRYMLSSQPIGNFRYLREFESGDATHTEAFSLVAERAISLKKGWRIASDGVLTRDTSEPASSPSEDNSDDEEDDDMDSIFSTNLIKWAWNGTTDLPVSPLPLYFR